MDGLEYFMNYLASAVAASLLVLKSSIVRAQEVETEKPQQLLSDLALTEKKCFL